MHDYMYICASTVNRETFVVKIFSDSMASAKIMRIINDNAVWGRFVQKFITRNICDAKYL